MKKILNSIQIKSINKDFLNLSKIKSIEREGKSNIFSHKLKKNVTKYLYDFLYYKELLTICPTNIFLHNCLSEYEMSSWSIELRNIIDIFNLDVKNIKEEIWENHDACVKKNVLFKMKNYVGNYVKINEKGINIISSVYQDPDIQLQLNNLNNNNLYDKNFDINFNNSFDSFSSFGDEEIEAKNNKKTLLTPWKVVYSQNSYNKGNIIFLEEKSPLDFGFSFNNVIKGNYKFYLHQNILNMKNAKLILKININNIVIYEAKEFPNNEILNQFSNNNNSDNNINYILSEDEEILVENKKEICLKETYICDINEAMFDKIKNNIKKSFESKNTFDSVGSTESSTSKSSNKSDCENINDTIKKYIIRVSFKNQHLFWKAGWYLDGGKLVKYN